VYVIPSLFKHCLGSSPGLTLSSLLNFDQALGAFLFTTISFPLLRELTSIQVGSQQSGGHAAIAHEHQKTQFTWSSTHTLGFDLSLHSDIQTKRENRPQAEANYSTLGNSTITSEPYLESAEDLHTRKKHRRSWPLLASASATSAHRDTCNPPA